MAIFTTHAAVVTPDHRLMKAYNAGSIATPPGRVFSELLEDTGGAYEIALVIPQYTVKQLRQVAEVNIQLLPARRL
jgi:hypothetical protein